MTRRQQIARQEATRDPVFLFQCRWSKQGGWQTETVFLTREEGEAWGEAHSYRWQYWRVFCVAATGSINDVLDAELSDGVAE